MTWHLKKNTFFQQFCPCEHRYINFNLRVTYLWSICVYNRYLRKRLIIKIQKLQVLIILKDLLLPFFKLTLYLSCPWHCPPFQKSKGYLKNLTLTSVSLSEPYIPPFPSLLLLSLYPETARPTCCLSLSCYGQNGRMTSMQQAIE